MSEPLTGTVALVTGSSSGIGAATARRLAAEGAAVALVARRRDRLDELASTIRAAAGTATVVPADVTQQRQAQDAVEQAVADLGRLDIVVNNAGVMLLGPSLEASTDEWDRMVALNVQGLLYVTHAALPHLVAAGGGAVVCMSSRSAVAPFRGAAGYAAAKAAVLAFAQAVAVEYRADGVRCNAVLPSVIDTPANRAKQPDADWSRWVPPQQVAGVIRFLCGEESAPTSGAAIPVYGRA